MGKLLDNGHKWTSRLNKTAVSLLSRVDELKDHFNSQHIANLLWAMAKLAQNGEKLIPQCKKSLAILLPRVSALKDQFNAQAIANILWAEAKLVDHGQSLTPELEEAVTALLPCVMALRNRFAPRHIANLLWAIAKLMDHGQQLTPGLKGAVAVLLPRVNELKDQYNGQDIANLLWATAYLGDLINTAATETLIESLPCQSDKYSQFSLDELLMSLWGLLACRARFYLERNISDKNRMLEYQINSLFTHLAKKSIEDEQKITIMAMAAGWLGREYPFDPNYLATNSKAQSFFFAQLQSVLPALIIVQEKSLHALPPVDLFLPEHNIAIEIQGPSHYVGHDFQTRNGSTLLKIALLQKAGYDVLEIPVSHLHNPDSVKTYVEQVRQKTTGFKGG